MNSLFEMLYRSKCASASQVGPNKSRQMQISRQGDRWRFNMPHSFQLQGIDTRMRYFRDERHATYHLHSLIQPLGLSLEHFKRPSQGSPPKREVVEATVDNVEDDPGDGLEDTAQDILDDTADKVVEDMPYDTTEDIDTVEDDSNLKLLAQTALEDEDSQLETRLAQHAKDNCKSSPYLFVERAHGQSWRIQIPDDLKQFVQSPPFVFRTAKEAHMHIKAALQHQTQDEELLFA